MSDTGTGLMQPQAERNTTQRSEMLDAFRDALAPLGGSQTLEDKLQALTPSQRDMLLSTAKMVKMAMAGKVAAGDYSMGYADLLAQMYGRMDIAKRQLIAELLDETAPLEFVPQPKPHSVIQLISAFMIVLRCKALSAASKAAMVEQDQRHNSAFLETLLYTRAKAAVIVMLRSLLQDGRRYVGALQFGDARLQDYQGSNWLFVYAG